MAVDLAKYVVRLEAQTAQYISNLDQANKKLDRFHRDQQRAVQKIKSAFLTLGTSFAAAFSVREIGRFAVASIQLADEIGKVSKAAGISAETLQELRFALGELGGVTQKQADVGLQRFNRQLGLAANGSKEAADQFKLLGVAFKGVQTPEALDATLKALGAIENDAQRAAIAGRIFGEELGPKLSGALKGGSQAMDEARAQVTGLISNERVRQAEALNDAFHRLAGTIGGPLKSAAIATGFALAEMFGFVEKAPAEILNQKIADTEQRIKDLTRAIEINKSQTREGFLGWLNAEGLDRDLARLSGDLLQAQMNLSVFRAALAPVGRTVIDEAVEGLQEIEVAARKISLDDLLKPLSGDVNRFLNPDGLEEIVVGAKPLSLDDMIKPFPDAEVRQLFEPIKKGSADAAMAVGENFRSAFAGWILGAERSFSDLLKRMAAEVATSAIFKGLAGLFPGGSFFSNFFGGFRAEGGPLDPGKWYIAGEYGPEPVWGGGAGAFAMGYSGGGGAVTIINNIDARGADPSILQRMPRILADNNQRLKAEIAHDRNRGR